LDTVNGNQVGSILSTSDVISAKNGSNGSNIYKNSISNKNELAVSIPLNNGNEQVGIARFIISMENIDSMIAQRYLVFFLFGFFVIIIGVSISIFMSTKIVNPIEKLTNVALKLADGQLNEKADEVGDYEISKLGSTMNLMSENLVKKEQLKKDFISSVSHELRTPLTVIKGWAFTLQPEAKGNKLLEDGLSIIEKESDRLGNMVTELLDFSEISSGRLIMNKELFDLNELGIFINKQLMPKSSSKKIDMILNYDETKRVMVMADRDRIKQVFINILDNALKFTDEGGVVLTDIKIEEDKAIIEVIDNGCGISEDEISLVTGKFYKGTNSNSHTGLGLSICEEIVKAHNGNLIIRSVLEKGTVVRVELPLEKGDIQNEA
ncbi:MAG: ATP-binding protein, partial [Parvimonas micra]